jgi:hypothetical protein
MRTLQGPEIVAFRNYIGGSTDSYHCWILAGPTPTLQTLRANKHGDAQAQQSMSEIKSAEDHQESLPSAGSPAFLNPDAVANAIRALEYSPAAIVLASLSGELLCINVEAERIFDIAHGKALKGRYIAEIFSEQLHLSYLEAVARDGQERQFDMFRTSDGAGSRHFLCKLTRVPERNGIPAWLVLVVFEHDHRTSADDATIDDVETARIIRQLSGIAVWKIRRDDDKEWADSTMQWSEELFYLLNLNPALRRQTLRDYMEFVFPEDREAVFAALSRSLTEGSKFEAVYRLTPKNSTAKVMASRAIAIRDPVTGKTREMWGVEQDVTPIFGGQLLPREKASILDTVASSMDGPLYAVDREFRLIYFNEFFREGMQRVFGVDARLGNKVADDDQCSRRKTILSNIRRALAGTRMVEEISIPLDASAARHYELTYSPIRSASTTIGVVVFGVPSTRDTIKHK